MTLRALACSLALVPAAAGASPRDAPRVLERLSLLAPEGQVAPGDEAPGPPAPATLPPFEPDFAARPPRWQQLPPPPREPGSELDLRLDDDARLAASLALEPLMGAAATIAGLSLGSYPLLLALGLTAIPDPLGPPTDGERMVVLVASTALVVFPGLAAGAGVHAIADTVGHLRTSQLACIAGGLAGSAGMAYWVLAHGGGSLVPLLLPTAGAMLGCHLSTPFLAPEPGPAPADRARPIARR